MLRTKGKVNRVEAHIASLLRAAGLRFQRHDKSLPGHPDFVFPDARVVVFVNRHVWRGRRLSDWRHGQSSSWLNKIGPNCKEDGHISRKLSRLGWKVVQVWEHQVEGAALNCVRRIVRALGATGVDWEKVEAKHRTLPPLKARNKLPKP